MLLATNFQVEEMLKNKITLPPANIKKQKPVTTCCVCSYETYLKPLFPHFSNQVAFFKLLKCVPLCVIHKITHKNSD